MGSRKDDFDDDIDKELAQVLAKFLAFPDAARLVLAGLSVLPHSQTPVTFTVGKPKSTSGHCIADYEVWQCASADSTCWGGICCDAPILELSNCDTQWHVEHRILYLGGNGSEVTNGPRGFRRSYDTLAEAVEFILRFHFRDKKLFDELTRGY